MSEQKIIDATDGIMDVANQMLQVASFIARFIRTEDALVSATKIITQSGRITCLCEEILNEVKQKEVNK